MTTTKFWNYNILGETDKGFKNVVLDYSLDGTSWIELNQFQIPEATGMNDYTGPDFNNIMARYVLVFAEDTWANTGSCAGLSELRIGVEEIVLPVDGITFNANPKTELIVLDWTNFGEFEFSHFDIEKSLNGIDFIKINQVEGKGSKYENKYVLLDREVRKGIQYYYRLKMIDLDNSYEYSEMRTAILDRTLEIQLYPNPVSNVLNITLDGYEFEEAGMEVQALIILDMQGHEIKRLSLQKNYVQLDVSFLPSDTYFITIVDKDNFKETRRFVKMK